MRVVIQRVKHASVCVDSKEVAKINHGLLVFLGVEDADVLEDVNWLGGKIARLRVFESEDGNMNLNVNDVNGEVLIVSQFTLYASTKKGNRPSFLRSSKPEFAHKMYLEFLKSIHKQIDKPIQKGVFGANMQIELLNDGPITISIDSKNKE